MNPVQDRIGRLVQPAHRDLAVPALSESSISLLGRLGCLGYPSRAAVEVRHA